MPIEKCRWRPLVGMYYKVNLSVKESQNNGYQKINCRTVYGML